MGPRRRSWRAQTIAVVIGGAALGALSNEKSGQWGVFVSTSLIRAAKAAWVARRGRLSQGEIVKGMARVCAYADATLSRWAWGRARRTTAGGGSRRLHRAEVSLMK